MLEVGPRGRWKRSSIFQSSHPSQKNMLSKANEQKKKKTICQIFHQKKIWKVLMKIEEMADIFLNSANFASHAFLTSAPPSGYALNLKIMIKVSKVSWTSQLSYELLRSSFKIKFDKTNFISPKKTPPKSPQFLGLKSWHFEASKDIMTKFKPQALHIIKIKYCKASGSGNPPSLIPALRKIAILGLKTGLWQW